jgi:outer membrane protein OmpA-like peptidoglycan-associated protein
MKRFIVWTLLVAGLGVYSNVQAQFKNPRQAFGVSLGGATGDNSVNDKWGIQARGFYQYEFVPALLGQVGVSYADLDAPGYYRARVLAPDLRLLVVPFSLTNLNPFVYAGFGLSKTLNITNSNWLALVPMGVGAQTKIASGLLLQISGGYNLSLSDQLDGREHAAGWSNNFLTGGKQDGFWSFSIGLAFGTGHDNEEADKERRMRSEENARRARELANAEARRVQDSTNAAVKAASLKQANDAEARRIRELAAAETRRVQDSTNAASQAARLKAASMAEAQRVKDSTNAAALRKAQQKAPDTLIVLEKGKKVVLKGVNFESGKATLTKDSETILWRAYNALVANPTVKVVITGHTDNVGSQKANQALSLQRAQAVKNWLVKKGIPSSRLRTVGRGENEPVASNKTKEGRAENRRMEFYVE